jgi:hypothetical protein
MDEMRKAVQALADEARLVESQMLRCEDPPSKAQLSVLQRSVDRIQQRLNRLQTAMDSWSEEREEV